MTTQRDFDRIAMAWLVDGPTELPERVLDAAVDQIHLTRQRRALRVPWRFPTMSTPVRLAAIAAVAAIILAGALAIGGGRSTPIPSIAPTAPPATAATLSTVGIPVLDQAFASTRNGYTVEIPSGATVTPAIKAWATDELPPVWGSTALDEIVAGDIRFVATDQPKPTTQTAEQWLQSYCQSGGGGGGADCAAVSSIWEKTKVSGADAYISTDGIAAASNTISPGGKLYEAVVVTPTRAWVFTMDGNLDRAGFDAFLETIRLRPVDAVDLPPLTSTFTSPLFGYSIKTTPTWPTHAATKPWTGVNNDTLDGIDVTQDEGLGASSQALGSRTFDEFVAAFHANQKAHVPSGCDGGEPSTWPTVPIGDQIGHLEVLCLNNADALVEVGGRVYLFEWGDSLGQFPLQTWKELLKGVTFTPLTAP